MVETRVLGRGASRPITSEPVRTTQAVYIVNTDPEGEPSRHWLAIFTDNGVCEVFDISGLPRMEPPTYLNGWTVCLIY